MSSAVNFSGKVVIITGSSSGIGQAAAILFAKAGASVTIHGRSEEGLKKTLDSLKASGIPEDKICVVKGDIIEESTLKALIENTVAKFGKIDVLINNVGLATKAGETNPRSMENYDYVMNVNVRSIVALTELAIPYLEKTKGNIVNVSSIVAFKAYPTVPFYAMSKAALDHFARNYAAILSPKGIRVNNLNPGPIDTQFLPRTGVPENMLETVKKSVPNYVALGRWGTSEEMAELLLFLASDKAAYITGVTLAADGGLLIHTPTQN